MNLDKMPFNWFDMLVIILLGVGLYRGRKRGMSEEMLSSLMWVAIVAACSFGYEPLGQFLTTVSPFSHLFSYVVCYVLAAVGVWLVFVLIRRGIGGKLIGSDTFGTGEYYLAMPAGMLRFACILIVGLALLNARFYSAAELRAEAIYRKDVYGSDFFPGLNSTQKAVFEESLLGPQIQKHLSFLLIKPTAPETTQLKRAQDKLP